MYNDITTQHRMYAIYSEQWSAHARRLTSFLEEYALSELQWKTVQTVSYKYILTSRLTIRGSVPWSPPLSARKSRLASARRLRNQSTRPAELCRSPCRPGIEHYVSRARRRKDEIFPQLTTKAWMESSSRLVLPQSGHTSSPVAIY